MDYLNLKTNNFSPSQLLKISRLIKRGGLIIYPTETCYGAGVAAACAPAVTKLLHFKGNRLNKAISLAVADRKMAQKYVRLNPIAENLYRNFLPGPVTVISQSKGFVDSRLESPAKTLGIRIPDYRPILKLIDHLKTPLTATSANASHRKPPYSKEDFLKYNPQKSINLVDLFIDAGPLPLREPSTVVDTTLHEPLVLRRGSITLPSQSSQKFTTDSESATIRLAQTLLTDYQSQLAQSPLFIILQGELGAGKTRFAKGIGKYLKIRQAITSPTFSLIKEYPYRHGVFYHLDAWKLEKGSALNQLGIGKYFKPRNIIALEWPEKISAEIQNYIHNHPTLLINLKLGKRKNRRRITVCFNSPQAG